MTSPYDDAIRIANGLGLVIFLVLLGGILSSLIRRVLSYRQRGAALPVILKRGIVLFTALAVLAGEAATLRVLGIDLTVEGAELERLVFIIQSNVVVDLAFAYYLKTELIDMEDPDKP